MAQAKSVDIPEDVLDWLARSRLSGLAPNERVRTALALHLFVAGEVSLGKAAELAGRKRYEFEQLLRDLDLPLVVYDQADYEADKIAVERIKRNREGA